MQIFAVGPIETTGWGYTISARWNYWNDRLDSVLNSGNSNYLHTRRDTWWAYHYDIRTICAQALAKGYTHLDGIRVQVNARADSWNNMGIGGPGVTRDTNMNTWSETPDITRSRITSAGGVLTRTMFNLSGANTTYNIDIPCLVDIAATGIHQYLSWLAPMTNNQGKNARVVVNWARVTGVSFRKWRAGFPGWATDKLASNGTPAPRWLSDLVPAGNWATNIKDGYVNWNGQ